MTREDLTKRKIPNEPGVYFFLGKRKEILYIGKATSLKNRVRSYFTSDVKEKRSEVIEQMVAEAKALEWTVTDSVLEALILETNLIRTHKPQYNTRSKDDKSYNHLVITNEAFPRVLIVRGKDLTEQFTEKEVKYHFGPFPSGQSLREALKIIRRLFKYYDTSLPVGAERSKMARGQIDFNRQIGLYPDVQSKQEYQKTIRHLRLFFEGKKKQIIKELEREMKVLAKEERFEEADTVKRKIFAMQHIQDIALIKDDMRVYRDDRNVRIEAYDIAHLGGSDMVGVMTVVEGGEAKASEYRKFKIKSIQGSNDTAALKEVLERRLGHPEWPYPQIVVVDGSTAQKNAAEFVLRKVGAVIPVVAVVKDERHRPVRILATKAMREAHENSILLANAESHRFAVAYHTSKRRKRALQ
ncbi:MAG: GIY-YIG nuclease family protein [Candidatus Paceibacterota bacterium]